MNKPNEPFSPTTSGSQHQDNEIGSLYEYVSRRDVGEHGFKASIAAMYERNARWSNPVFDLGVTSLGKILEPVAGSVKYFFWGNKFEEIILGLPKKDICIIGGPKQLKLCLKQKIHFIPCMRPWKILASGLSDKNRSNTEIEIESHIIKIGNIFQKKAQRQSVLIVDNDSLPMQRAMILAARRANLKTVCIQHGIFSSKSQAHIVDGWYADQFMALNELQKSMLVSKGIPPQKIKVMGFYSSPYAPKRATAPAGQRKVCFLGQPWHKYGAKRADLYMEIIERAASTLQAEGIPMSYKPHPWEKGCDHLKKIKNVVNTDLNDTLEHHDAFISLTSTALIEAQAAARIAIQLMHDAFDADDLSMHGTIATIDLIKQHNWEATLIASIHQPTPKVKKTEPPEQRLIKCLLDSEHFRTPASQP